MAKDYYKYNQLDCYASKLLVNGYTSTGYEQYYSDIYSFWRELYNPEGDEEVYDETTHWIKTLKTAPDQLNFWFDFLDSDGELS
jgi:hypothetical protein